MTPSSLTAGSLTPSRAIYRFRYPIHLLVFLLGFTTPWDRWLHLDGVTSTWLTLSGALARSGVLSFSDATVAVLVLAIACTLAAAALRTWGTAYLGTQAVRAGDPQASRILSAGPYGYVRNPLYLGTWLHTLGLSILMLPSGAVFTLIVIPVLQGILIHGEERFLTGTLGPAYAEYCAVVPRLLPRLRPSGVAQAALPHWGRALLAEIYLWCVAASFAALGWRYNAFLLTQCVLVSLGIALIVRALPLKETPAA